jgi:uncharacterized membrane protein
MIVFGALFVAQIGVGMLLGAFIMMRLVFFIPLFSLLNTLIILVALILWVILMVKAYQGEKFKLPVAGDIAEKHI